MQADRIGQLFEEMRDRNSGVDTFIMSALLNSMVGRSLEAILPVMEAAHDRLSEHGGPVALSGGSSAEALAVPEGPHGGVWRKAILVTDPAGFLTLTVLERDGEPDPKMDAIMESVFASKGAVRPPREPRLPGPVDEIRVYGAKSRAEAVSLLAGDAADGSKWSPQGLLEASESSRPYGGERGWGEYRSSTVSGSGLDRYPEYFADVKSLISETGLTAAMAGRSAEISGRIWTTSRTGQYLAAHIFGTEAAAEDGYLPGAACTAALDDLSRLSVEAEMVEVAANLRKLDELLKANPGLLEDGVYSANDGRTVVKSFTAGASGSEFELEDQNNFYGVTFSGLSSGCDSISVVATRGCSLEGPKCLELEFARQSGGSFTMSGRVGQSADSIRSWNSLTSMVSSLAVCAEEDIAYLPSARAP